MKIVAILLFCFWSLPSFSAPTELGHIDSQLDTYMQRQQANAFEAFPALADNRQSIGVTSLVASEQNQSKASESGSSSNLMALLLAGFTLVAFMSSRRRNLF